MRKDPIRKALEAIQNLRSQGSSDATVTALREMLGKEAGIVVGKAAELAAQWYATELAADLCAAFSRLSEDAAERDPQCWGKIALIKALFELAWQDEAVYVQGCRIVQLESVYGGKEDSAAAVRAAAIGALVQLPGASSATIMSCLADALADPSASVRAAAAHRSVHASPALVYPLLRLKVRMGDADPRVLGSCFDALLVVESSQETVDLVLEYTHTDSDVVQAEALAALASSSSPAAVTAAVKHYSFLDDTQLKRVLLTALGGSSTQEAFDFLLDLVSAPKQEATWALKALGPKLMREEARESVYQVLKVRGDADLLELFMSSDS